MKNNTKGLILIWISLTLWLFETFYFGNNFLPQSYWECGADSLSLGLFCLGYYFFIKKKK